MSIIPITIKMPLPAAQRPPLGTLTPCMATLLFELCEVGNTPLLEAVLVGLLSMTIPELPEELLEAVLKAPLGS